MTFDPGAYKDLLLQGPTAVFATVSGAHLYGFESPDSDVDLRGAFAMSLDERLSLRLPQETYERSFDAMGTEMDWVAHDIRKFARLMTRRNGYVLEQLYSPLVVFHGGWLQDLRQVAQGCIVRHLYHHYRGFAHNKLKEASAPDATVKDLLYAYRVTLTGFHVLRTGVIESHLPTLLEDYPQSGVHELITRKRAGEEFGPLLADDRAHLSLVEELVSALEDEFRASSLPDEVTSFDELDSLVIRICRECAG